MTEYHWVEDEDWNKVVGQFRLRVTNTLSVFAVYGMNEYIPGAVEEIVDLAVIMSQKARGKDKPYLIKQRNPRR